MTMAAAIFIRVNIRFFLGLSRNGRSFPHERSYQTALLFPGTFKRQPLKNYSGPHPDFFARVRVEENLGVSLISVLRASFIAPVFQAAGGPCTCSTSECVYSPAWSRVP